MQHPPAASHHDDDDNDNDDDAPFAQLRAALRELEPHSVPIPISVGTMVIARPAADRPSPPAPVRVVVRNVAAPPRALPPRPKPPSRPRSYRTYEGTELVDTRPFRRGVKPSSRIPVGSIVALTLVAVFVALVTSFAMDYVGVDDRGMALVPARAQR